MQSKQNLFETSTLVMFLKNILDKDYISLTTSFMEAMAIIGVHMSVIFRGNHPQYEMGTFFERATVATTWIERQRSSTTVREMEFFKERRNSLFRQWGLGGRGPQTAFRDEKGKFIAHKPQESLGDSADDRSSSTADSKPNRKRKCLEAYGDIFSQYYS